MMIVRISYVLTIAISLTNAVVNKDVKRREAVLTNSYGPPPSGQNIALPIPIYGTPSQGIQYPPPPPDVPPPPPVTHQHYAVPQQEYGVPQRKPHREYGIPVAKYGPPKLNLQYGAPGKHGPNFGQPGKNSFYEQIKSHFGVTRPIYGPPNYQKLNSIFNGGNGRPFSNYGPPPQQPRPVYGAPPFRSPPNFINKLPSNYGTPPLSLGPKPGALYGPPKINPIYGPPSTSYGVPDNSISLETGSAINNAAISAALSLPQKELQIQIEPSQAPGHDYRIGNTLPIPTVSCDGWRPIPGPVGQVSQQHNFVHNQEQQLTHNIGQNQGFGIPYHGLTDDQLIAVALQSGLIDGSQQNLQYESIGNIGIEQPNSLQVHGVDDSYNRPPPDSYAPNSIHAAKYNTLSGDIANVGLVPPTNVYGAPSSNHYQQSGHDQTGLGIQYGSESGNLRPWLNSGSAPRTPVSFRPPVPEGLLESIGQSVKHLDQFGIKPDNSQRQYIPPPSEEVPQHYQQQQQQFQNQNEQNLHSYASEHISYQALPGGNAARFNQPQDCGHGPNLVGANTHYEFGSNQLSNTNAIEESEQNHFLTAGLNGLNYGPPNGGILDNSGYESKQSSVSVQQSLSKDSHISESKLENLPGLGSLNVISAQKSQSVTIPIQGQLGSYQLQFQNTNSGNDGAGGANHEQILSQGLLQSILSAIEQPSESNIQQIDNLNDRVDHKDVEDFLKSPEGKKVLAEPKQ